MVLLKCGSAIDPFVKQGARMNFFRCQQLLKTKPILLYRFFLICLCLPLCTSGQNLVPNGSFEERVECIVNNGIPEDAPPWSNCQDGSNFLQASPDLFHECAVVINAPCPYPDSVFTINDNG